MTPHEKLVARRAATGAGLDLNFRDPNCLRIVGSDAAWNNRNTFAIGLFTLEQAPIGLYASQDGKADYLSDLVDGDPYLRETKWVNVNEWMLDDKKTPSGLHAEMAIIRYLYEVGLLTHEPGKRDAERTLAARINLRIVCLGGKPLCADCAGWLKAHGIPHYPVGAGNGSAQWIHPRTGALYTPTFYIKNIPGQQMPQIYKNDNSTLPSAASQLRRIGP